MTAWEDGQVEQTITATGRVSSSSKDPPQLTPSHPYCHKPRLWAVREHRAVLTHRLSVLTGAETSQWDTVQKNTASPETHSSRPGTHAKRPTILVKPLQLRSPSTASSSTTGPEHKHLEGGEANLVQLRGSWWGGGAVLKTQPWKMSPQDDRAEEINTQGWMPAGSQSPAPPCESPAVWLWAPGQSEALTLELLQDHLALQVVGELVHPEELAVVEGGQVVDVDLPGLREEALGEPCGGRAPRAQARRAPRARSRGQPAGLRPHHQEERTGLHQDMEAT